MINDRLFINGVEMQLSPGTVIAITFQINDLGDLKDRQADFSNKFKIPKSQANIAALGFSDLIQTNTTVPYRKLPALLIKGAKSLSGFCILETADANFNVTFYTGMLDLFTLLDSKKMNELSGLAALNHYWNFTSLRSTRANQAMSGVSIIYPVIDWSDDPVYFDNISNSINVTRSLPCIFIADLVQMIFDDAGFTYSGELFSLAKYLRLIMTLCNDDIFFNGRLYFATTNVLDPPQTGPNILAVETPIDSLGNALLQTGTFDIGDAGDGLFYIIPVDVQTRNDANQEQDFTLVWSLINLRATSAGGGTFVIRIRENISSTTVYESAPITVTAGVPLLGNYTAQLPSGSYTAGSKFSCRIQWTSGTGTFEVGIPGIFGGTSGGATLTVETRGQVPLSWGTNWPMFIPDMMPDMTQKEFLKGILVYLFNAFPVNRRLGAEKQFVRFKEIIQNIPQARQWRFHYQKGREEKQFREGSYAQKNWLRYQHDDGVVPDEYGDGFFLIDDETLDMEKDLLTMPFAASNWVARMENGHRKVPLVKRWDDVGNPSIGVQPRLLMLDTEEPAQTPFLLAVDPVGGVNADYDDVCPYCHFSDPDHGDDENLDFTSIIATEYHELITRCLNRFKKVIELALLSDNDINDLDHTIPIYRPEHGAYFYINKVINYNGRELTKTELIRI